MGKNETNKSEGSKRVSGTQKQQPKRTRNEKDDDGPSSSGITVRRQASIRVNEAKRTSVAGTSLHGPLQVMQAKNKCINRFTYSFRTPERKEAEVPTTTVKRIFKKRETKGRNIRMRNDHREKKKRQTTRSSFRQVNRMTTKMTTIKRMPTGPLCG